KIFLYVVSPARTEGELRKLLTELHQRTITDIKGRPWKSGGPPGLWIYVYPDDVTAAEGADKWIGMLAANPIDGVGDIDIASVITRPVAPPKAQPGREVVGSWRRTSPALNYVVTVFRESGTYKIERRFDDGSHSVETVIRSKHRDGVKYAEPANEFGEFVVVLPNGRLGFYGRDGKFDEAAPIR
ncbi:MAG: hypothetical protein ACREA0_09075, partial [bacterium]